jgi:hypothetical protein
MLFDILKRKALADVVYFLKVCYYTSVVGNL